MFTIQRNTVSSDYKYLSITIVLSVYLDDVETSVFAAGSAPDRGSIWWQATGDFEKQRGFYMVRKSIFEYIVYNWSEIAIPSIAVLLFILLNKQGKII